MSGAIPSWVKVGAKVICVDARSGIFVPANASFRPDLGGLRRGEIYTIREVGICPNWNRQSVWLEEIHRPEDVGGESGFAIERFRPVKTIEDDISEHFAIFLSTPATQPVEMAS